MTFKESTDLTPKEQKENKALRNKLAELNQTGKNFKIKNGQIVQRANYLPPAQLVRFMIIITFLI